jgi:hypothetical protein
VWSFVVGRLITGKQLFPGQTSHATAIQWGQKVAAGIRANADDIADSVQGDLLVRCWSRDPSQRPSFAEIFG